MRVVKAAVACLALCSGLLAAPSAQASEPMTLGAMIALEAQTIARAQAKREQASAKKRRVATLLSIYGVPPRLHAVVQVNTGEITFVQGQAKPLGAPAGRWRLRFIKPPCVSLTHAGRRHTVCLPKGG
jgi:hypothetical protein